MECRPWRQGGILRIEAQSSKDSVEIQISDSGSGISPDQMEKIFNYYYTTKEKGVGLGLPIAHRIIEAHGGQLKVESQVGSGTKVTIILPIKRERLEVSKVKGDRFRTLAPQALNRIVSEWKPRKS